MWKGAYGFFDYKYNIEGYSGQDYDGAGRWVYLIFSVVSILVFLFLFRKASEKQIGKYIKIVGILMPALEISKVTWESIWDVRTGRGFNWEGLLPIYLCSMFIYCMLIAAFSRGKLREWCLSWVCTLGFVGGMSNLLFIQGLKWYPFFTFGAFYSMFFHYIMVFTSLFLVVTGYCRFAWRDIFRAYAVHAVFSAVVIPLDYIFHWDYMQYYEAGGVPLIEGIVERLAEAELRFLTVPLMLAVYFALTALLSGLYILYGKMTDRRKKPQK